MQLVTNAQHAVLLASLPVPPALEALNSQATLTIRDRQLLADSVEKVGFSDRLNSGTTTTGEPTHHVEWFFGPSVTFAALLLG